MGSEMCIRDRGEIAKISLANAPDRFDKTTAPHYHAKCNVCGKLSDLEMSPLPDLKQMVRNAHGLAIESYEILFSGTCPECINKNKKGERK